MTVRREPEQHWPGAYRAGLCESQSEKENEFCLLLFMKENEKQLLLWECCFDNNQKVVIAPREETRLLAFLVTV